MLPLLTLRSTLVGIFLTFWMTGCRQPEPAEYFGFQNLVVGQIVAGKTNLSAIVKLYNPNTFRLALKRAEADITVNGQHAGHTLLDSTIVIPPRDTFYVPVTLQLDMKGLFSNALQMLLGKREANLVVDGRVKVRKGMFTFNRSIHYEGKQDLSSLMQ
ncbi:MAG TPA: LEA type 2 family protein [Puia sp.]|nr:LEA type 2 family protein [Puia sp.]